MEREIIRMGIMAIGKHIGHEQGVVIGGKALPIPMPAPSLGTSHNDLHQPKTWSSE